LFLYQSNHLEALVDQLCVVLNQHPAPPLAAETIVVPHHGMAQWVALQIARRTGIAAHFTFPLPGRFFGEILADLTEEEKSPNLDRQTMLWRIYNLLPECIQDDRFAEVRHYLQDENNDIKRYQLAGAVSDVFDKYQIYRPDIITAWDTGEDESWQAVLWRKISQGIPHRASLFQRLLSDPEALNKSSAGSAELSPLPEHCYWFGLNALPPVYLEMLHQLSSKMEVHLFHLSPCQEFWGDVVSEKKLARQSSGSQVPEKREEEYFETGNPLLSSWGGVGQEFLQLLLEYDINQWEQYQPDPNNTLLGALHNQILTMEDTTQADVTPQFPLQADPSLQFHVCHSPFREVQVLHDQLLRLIEDTPGLTASDILVTAPDIEVYSAAIRGVFSSAHSSYHLPYYIADSTLSQESISTQAFLDLVNIFFSRCSGPQIMALLEIEPIRARFGISGQDLPLLHQWVKGTQIRWGFDAEHRQEFEAGGFRENTWEVGLDRLMLGYFMGESDDHFDDLYPHSPGGTGDADLLGSFATFVQTLRRWRPALRKVHPAEEWSRLLLDLLHDFFDLECDPEGCSLITETLLDFSQETEGAAITGALTPELILHHLTTTLKQPTPGRVFLTGRVTFCNMVPMRSVPFSVICLLGMNDGAFPRNQQLYSFDHTSTRPRLGDRNRRKDDRYLFLEILLSAQHIFYVSWIGKDQRSNEDVPPSIVVSELLEYLDRSTPEGSPPLSEQLTVYHPLQPFSPRAFAPQAHSGSYNSAWLPAAQKTAVPPFVDGERTSQLEPPAEIQLRELIQFWRHPVRYFLNLLAVRPRISLHTLKESEPFSLNSLEQYMLRQTTTDALLEKYHPEEIEHQLQTGGILPCAGFGRYLFQEIASSSQAMISQLGKHTGAPLEPLEIDVTVGPFQLTGWLDSLYAEEGRITWKSSAVTGSTLMELWINHLLLQIAAPDTLPRNSRHISKQEITLFTPVGQAEEYLERLLVLFQEGHLRPLHFFPKSSYAAAKAKPGKERDKASNCWRGNYFITGEGEEPEYQLLFDADPARALNDEFFTLCELFLPIFNHTETSDAAA